MVLILWFFFFFKQKTAYEMRISDWSSDVCSSDLFSIAGRRIGPSEPPYVIAEMSGNHNGDIGRALRILEAAKQAGADAVKLQTYRADRSEERRVGKECVSTCRSRWSPSH